MSKHSIVLFDCVTLHNPFFSCYQIANVLPSAQIISLSAHRLYRQLLGRQSQTKIKVVTESTDRVNPIPIHGANIFITVSLHRNRIQFHELPYEGVQAASLGLSQVLLLKGMNTFIDIDHKLFWAWAGQVLLSPQSSLFSHSQEDMTINQLFGVCIRASLARTTPPPQSREDWGWKRRYHIKI